jgi:ActR/RegA family two-component response regulator
MAPTILIVDEEPHAVSALAAAFAGSGYAAIAAHSFAEAVRILTTTSPMAVITNVRLGAFNGLHLLVRARNQHPQMKVVVRGPANPFVESEARALGAAAYVTVSADARSVLSEVTALFVNAAGAQAGPATAARSWAPVPA